MNTLKTIGGTILGIVIFLGVILATILFFVFGAAIAFHIAPFIYWLSGIVLFIDVIALVAAITYPARTVSGIIIYISSYIFGLATWIYGLAVTLSLWGFIAVIIGVLLGGIGVVPIGMLAALFHGRWDIFFGLLIMIILTYASRLIGTLLASSGERNNEKAAQTHRNIIDIEPEEEKRTWKDIE